MDIEFVDNPPSAFFKNEKVLAVGDLHIGKELKLKLEGIHFPEVAKTLGESLFQSCKNLGAEKIVLLGDIKDSITYPDTDEYRLLREFFKPLAGTKLYVAKGNHDSHLQEVFKQIGVQAEVRNEILLGNTAFMHGTSLPSEQAMLKKYIVVSHLHAQAIVGGALKSVWILSGAGSGAKRFKKYNKRIRLLVAPAANGLISGTQVSPGTKEFLLLFRQGIFDFNKSKVYATDGKLLGNIGKLIAAKIRSDWV